MRRFMQGVHGFAVGAAIARTIRATAEEATGESIESWVQFCLKAADEARVTAMENPPTVITTDSERKSMRMLLQMGDDLSREDHAKYGAKVTNNAERYDQGLGPASRVMAGEELERYADRSAATAFCCCMPELTGRRRAQAYFACVAAGMQRGYFKGAEAKAMLHSAQLALNAFPKRQQKPRPARRNEEKYQHDPPTPHHHGRRADHAGRRRTELCPGLSRMQGNRGAHSDRSHPRWKRDGLPRGARQ